MKLSKLFMRRPDSTPYLFVMVSFLIHPITFVRDRRHFRQHFDRNGYPRNERT